MDQAYIFTTIICIQVAWDSCCRPKHEGGLGINDLHVFKQSNAKEAHLAHDD